MYKKNTVYKDNVLIIILLKFVDILEFTGTTYVSSALFDQQTL